MIAYLDFDEIYLEIKGNENEITSILFKTTKENDDFGLNSEVAKAKQQLTEYLAGTRMMFDLNLDLKTTPFNHKVYEEMQKIAYGELTSYKELAIAAGSPKAYRAVGNANNKNNFVIVIPCHRVIGSNKKLVGFAPGIRFKEKLIQLEKNGGQNG